MAECQQLENPRQPSGRRLTEAFVFFYHIFDETIFLRHFLDVKSNSKVRNADGMQNSGKADLLKKLEQFEQNL